MYLPRTLPLCTPHLALWTGESGKRYDFAVLRTGTVWIDEPAVYILARHGDTGANPLFVGETESLQLQFGGHRDRVAEEWRTAMANGMTHVHVRFEATTVETRRMEVGDLVAALQPMLNAKPQQQSAAADAGADTLFDAGGTAPAVAFVDDLESPTVRVPYRVARLSPSRPSVEIGEPASAQWLDESTLPVWRLRADPAREEDTEAVPMAAIAAVALPAEPPATSQRVDALESAPETIPAAELQAPVIPAPVIPAPVTPVLVSEGAHPHRQDADVAAATPPAVSGGQRRGGFLSRLIRFVTGRSELHPHPQPAVPQPGLQPGLQQATSTPETSAASSSFTPDTSANAAPVRPVAAAPGEAERDVKIAPTAPDTDSAPEPAPVEETQVQILRAEAPQAEAPEAEVGRTDATSLEDAAGAAAPSGAEQARARLQMAKRALGLDPQAPVVLFAGDVGWHGGADILFEAMLIVCAGHTSVQFMYAGNGPLRSELQERASHVALGPRCRFLGDVPAEQFPDILAAADFVAIPARSPQDETLARAALAQGKPVLVTHQSGIGCVVHGHNGLVTYDNSGSFVWGVRELLGPLYSDLLRHLDQAA